MGACHACRNADVNLTGGRLSATNLDVRTLTLTDNSVLTHPGATSTSETHLEITTDTLTIDSTSVIDVSARGYLAGRTLGNTTIGASTGLSGGSYGGLGRTVSTGQSNDVYGDFLDPNELGSGGSGNGAGSGGGLVRITAENIVLDGAIRADGETSFAAAGNAGGGGSGGGILISTNVIRSRVTREFLRKTNRKKLGDSRIHWRN